MDSERTKQKRDEMARLDEEKKLHPELFPETTWVDDTATLEILGIHIPGKDNLPQGYLKLLASDFIVEEVKVDGSATDISMGSKNPEEEAGETVYATLVKCGLSTIEAVEDLRKSLGIEKEKIQYAGIKDKDAITSQEISFRGIPLEKIQNISSPHFFLKNIRKGKGVVQKGGLKGNRFSILIRIGEDLENKKRLDSMLQAIKKVKEEGFYNFFYLQRFGTPRLNNYKWGISILRGDYEKAIRGLIADEGLREIPFFLEKRREIVSLVPDWKEVLKKLQEFPLIFPSEIKVVEHLISHPGDFGGALQRIEEQVMLWVSALASLLYNRKVSVFIMAGIKPPKTLPLFISLEKNDWLPYSDDLEGAGLFPPNFNTLRPFRSMRLQHKEIETMDRSEIHNFEVIPEGLVIEFTLGKGEYATTFLSHFVNLLGGKVPNDISEDLIDVKKILGKKDTLETLEHFSSLISQTSK